jgi:hypothetical protein
LALILSADNEESWFGNELVRELLRFSRCELLLLKFVPDASEQFENPEEGERSPLKAATKQRFLKT